MSARLLRLFLFSATLLLAQWGALSHALGHVQDQDRPHTPCALCVAYAAIDHAHAAGPGPLPLAAAIPPPVAAPAGSALVLPLPHYHARAPPPHLV